MKTNEIMWVPSMSLRYARDHNTFKEGDLLMIRRSLAASRRNGFKKRCTRKIVQYFPAEQIGELLRHHTYGFRIKKLKDVGH